MAEHTYDPRELAHSILVDGKVPEELKPHLACPFCGLPLSAPPDRYCDHDYTKHPTFLDQLKG